MFKLVVLFAVAAVAAANPGLLLPVAQTAVLPGVKTISQYDTSIVHPSRVHTIPVVHAAPLVHSTGLYGIARLHKRSIIAPAVSYSSVVPPLNPWVSGSVLGSRWASPLVSHLGAGLGYSTGIVHPY